MQREHLERLRPVCPTCRACGRDPRPLEVGTVVRAEGRDILEGVLLCPERVCQREHPIIDGIGVIVADLVSWASHQLEGALRRDDLSAFTESLLGDAAGPGSNFDRERQNLSSYGRAHWGDGEAEAALPQLMGEALAMLEGQPAGAWVDLGCSVGRATIDLARKTGDVVAGVDLNFSMLRVAERVRRHGRAVFPRRRSGVVYDRTDIAVVDVPREQVGFWCCDVTVLPFAGGTFSGAFSLNVLDCVPSPLGHLMELGRVLQPGAPALLTTPYDWSPNATAQAQWIGGHSQRGGSGGSSEAELRRILSPDAAAGIDTELTIAAECERVPWRVYVNDRASMDYLVHMVRLRRNR